jgi:hypothetical protein
MLYKTIVLELLQEQTQLHEQLRQQRQVLPVLNLCASELKVLHNHWKQMLAEACPGSQENLVASQALELAIEELRARLPRSVQPDEAFSLDEAIIASLMPSA